MNGKTCRGRGRTARAQSAHRSPAAIDDLA